MSDDFKLALQLSKPELKVSWSSYIGQYLLYSLFTFLFIQGFNAQESRFVGLDLFFLILFVYGPIWSRVKGLQFQQISGNIWASPTLIMGLHLPVKKQVIVLKSIILYLIGSFPFQLYMLIMLYLISPKVRGIMELDAYVSFVIIWLSFGIYAGLSALSADVGSNMKRNSLSFILSLLLIAVIIAFIFFMPFFVTYGVVEWTIILAKKWSMASAILSIIFAIIGIHYWKNKMVKLMKNTDYL
ncbi:hypothetical protein [Paucisalibacillus sp. EB02]|uniref:hypothetical protein n=1 Tax=Paucisalibacillus sp. EB02 TaxID=1347087 RepID=UPI0004AE43AF|nr:hypothetical protein [Paucisalibacillus sp. EB02]